MKLQIANTSCFRHKTKTISRTQLGFEITSHGRTRFDTILFDRFHDRNINTVVNNRYLSASRAISRRARVDHCITLHLNNNNNNDNIAAVCGKTSGPNPRVPSALPAFDGSIEIR